MKIINPLGEHVCDLYILNDEIVIVCDYLDCLTEIHYCSGLDLQVNHFLREFDEEENEEN